MLKCGVTFFYIIICYFFHFYRNECGIRRLFQRGVFRDYPLSDIKTFLQEKVHEYEKLSVKTIQFEYIRTLERAEDFFVHKLSFEKVCGIHLFMPFKKFFNRINPMDPIKLINSGDIFLQIYMIDNEVTNRKFEVQVSAEFGIKKRRTDTEKNVSVMMMVMIVVVRRR